MRKEVAAMPSRNRNRFSLLPLLAAGALTASIATPASADDVYLTNGKSFEGVIAIVAGSQVRIQMPGGEIRIPRASVARIETADSSFSEYTRRKEALGKGATAAQWLELARWAKANGFDPGVREAALKAAHLDPHLPGLPGLLKPVGYVFDEQVDSFIPYAESMRRQGYVQADGHWITREENAERVREREEREAHRAALAAAEASRRAADSERQLAELQAQQAAQAGPAPLVGDPYGTGGVYLPYYGTLGYGYSQGFRGGHRGGHMGRPGHSGIVFRQALPPGSGYDQLIGRQPGSLFPVNPPSPGEPQHPVKRH
jgi:hypothetical protein